MTVREYRPGDLGAMIDIWNEVVEAGEAFPQTEPLDEETGAAFFAAQDRCGVAEEDGEVLGLYILHPNNIGRCGHICNSSFAVSGRSRGKHIGEALVRDCLESAPRFGYRVLQLNAVVAENVRARKLYEKMGFVQLGVIPGGFLMKDGRYVDICPYYRAL